jgi:hypothetical protein
MTKASLVMHLQAEGQSVYIPIQSVSGTSQQLILQALYKPINLAVTGTLLPSLQYSWHGQIVNQVTEQSVDLTNNVRLSWVESKKTSKILGKSFYSVFLYYSFQKSLFFIDTIDMKDGPNETLRPKSIHRSRFDISTNSLFGGNQLMSAPTQPSLGGEGQKVGPSEEK